MNKIDRRMKRFLLKPLAEKSEYNDIQVSFKDALEWIDQRALSEGILPQVHKAFDIEMKKRKTLSVKNPDYIRSVINLVRVLYETRRFSTQEYVFHVCSPVIRLHEGRWLNKQYNNELGPISEAIDAIRMKHGLSPDEDWSIGTGPKEYRKLNKQYDEILEKRLIETLREFGLNELATLKEKRPEEFDKLFERGRRSFAHKDEYVDALKDVIDCYVEDAHKAASVQAYSSAVISISAGVEGLLLLRCLRSKKKVYSIAKNLSKRKRPQVINDPTTWTFQNLIDVCYMAGWLRPIKSQLAIYNPAGLAHMLRLMRNHIHPSKHAKERPWSEIDERDFKDVEATYVILKSALEKSQRVDNKEK